MWTIRQGDALSVLRTFPPDTFQACMTSPPYWGLRTYGTEPAVWGGDAACEHAWAAQERGRRKDILPAEATTLQSRTGTDERQNGAGTDGGRFCSSCGAWRGELGLEPSPDLYVEHIVSIFREVRRVLRPDGTLWLNLGDCYITEPHGRGDTSDPKHPTARTRGGDRGANRRSFRRDRAEVGNVKHRRPVWGLKHKDLAGIPHRVKDALQADGWWHRSTVVWSKPNPMPESIDDRPTTSHEYLFLMSRSGDSRYWTHRNGRGTRKRPRADFVWRNRQTGDEKRQEPADVPAGEFDPWIRVNLWKGHDYFYDADAIREPHTYGDHARNGVQGTVVQAPGQVAQSGITMRRSLGNRKLPLPSGWDTSPGDHRALAGRYRPHPGARGMPPQPAEGGAFHPLGRNKRSVWTIPTQPFPEAHFATFPEDLVLPCLLAGASAGGACPVCGAPRERLVDREFVPQPDVSHERGQRGAAGQKPMDASNSWEGHARGVTNHYMKGWAPTCECQTIEGPRACKVLDPFCGAATVGKVATRLGLDFVGVELSAEYVVMGSCRIVDDAPMFNRPESEN